MIKPGLVSITFRKLNPSEIIRLCSDHGLRGIEWGGDIHVPHGEIDRAREVGRQTRDAGLEVACYGSYYRCGVEQDFDFDAVIASARELGAPSIRVWVGALGSNDATEEDRLHILSDLHQICAYADREGLRVCAEKHDRTLTDTNDSTRDVIRHCPQENFRMLWQPSHGVAIDEALASLDVCLPVLENLHVFHWWPDGKNRQPLADGADRWRQYLGRSRDKADWALLEFVRRDDPEQLAPDAETLRQLLAEQD